MLTLREHPFNRTSQIIISNRIACGNHYPKTPIHHAEERAIGKRRLWLLSENICFLISTSTSFVVRLEPRRIISKHPPKKEWVKLLASNAVWTRLATFKSLSVGKDIEDNQMNRLESMKTCNVSNSKVSFNDTSIKRTGVWIFSSEPTGWVVQDRKCMPHPFISKLNIKQADWT